MFGLNSPAQPEATPIGDRPTLRALHPEFGAVVDKLAELNALEEALQRRLKPLRERLAKASVLGSVEQSAIPAPPVSKVHAPSAAAKLMLGDVAPAPIALPAVERREQHPDLAEFRAIGQKLETIREAKAHLTDKIPGQRYSAWEREHLTASRKLCDAVRPEYEAIAAEYCAALVALGKATVAHTKFVDDRLKGVAWASLRPIQVSQLLGDPLQPQSELRRMLAWAAEIGHFDLADLPKEWAESSHTAGAVHEWPKLHRGI